MSSSSLPGNAQHSKIDTRNKPAILGSAFRRTDSLCSVSMLVLQGSSRMSKTKMRCITCGKWFQSANAKEVTCPDCTQKARKEKMAAKMTPPPTSKTPGQTGYGIEGPARPVPPPPKPKPASGGTSHWLDSLNDVKVGQPDQPPPRPKLPSSPAPRENLGESERGADQSPVGPTTGGPGTYRDERGPGGYR